MPSSGMDGPISREVEVAGLHPASESIIPYAIGHVVPVPSETGPSYGDLDEEYLTANYRDVPERGRGPAGIRLKSGICSSSSPFWHAALYNCVSFIRDIAHFLDLKVATTRTGSSPKNGSSR